MNKIKINLFLEIFIYLFIIVLGAGCTTVDAFKNRYKQNVIMDQGDYDTVKDLEEIGKGLENDFRTSVNPLIKFLDFLGKGFEKIGL